MSPHAPRKGSLAFIPTKHSKEKIPANIRGSASGLNHEYYLKIGMTNLRVGEYVVPVTVLERIPLKKIDVTYYDRLGAIGSSKDSNLVRNPTHAKLKVALQYAQTSSTSKHGVPLQESKAKRSKIKFKQIPYNGTPEEAKKAFEDEAPLAMADAKFYDVIGLTKGKGFNGPVKRRGVKLQKRKASGKLRHTGALGTREPGKLTFKTPQAGQMGSARRTVLNLQLVKRDGAKVHLPNYGYSSGELVYLKGSVPGSIMSTVALRKAIRT